MSLLKSEEFYFPLKKIDLGSPPTVVGIHLPRRSGIQPYLWKIHSKHIFDVVNTTAVNK
jgi:hypothetical protein